MVKSINIFRRITDLHTFKEVFSKEFCPAVLQIPGVMYVELTSCIPLSSDLSQDVEGIELILEVYLDSEETLHRIISSPEAQSAMSITTKMPGELSIFLGREERVSLK